MPARPRDAASPAAPASPSQPRPWLGSDPRTNVPATTAAVDDDIPSFNADVLEVIAEYACGTVADACGLRGSCKGYRRAVDTTVRRLVNEDQPDLAARAAAADAAAAALLRTEETDQPRPPGAAERPTLILRNDGAVLTSVRIAFTCDRGRRVAKLIVVAFALDGPKDELYEAQECGLRPLKSYLYGVPDEVLHSMSDDGAPSLKSAPRSIRCALRRSQSEAVLGTEKSSRWWWQLEAVDPVFGGSPWPCLTSLHTGRYDGPDHRLAQLLSIVGPQLLHLTLDDVAQEHLGPIASCSRLQTFSAFRLEDNEERVGGLLCDALIASGAKLLSFQAPFGCPTADVLRLIEAVPTIQSGFAGHLPPSHPAHLRMQRIRSLTSTTPLPIAPSAAVHRVEASSEALRRAPDLATAFPNLRQLILTTTDADSDAAAGDVGFPPTLRLLSLCSDQADRPPSVAYVRRLLQRALFVGVLGHLHIELPQCGVPSAGLQLDMAPLAELKSTLMHLALGNRSGAVSPADDWSTEDLDRLEAALAQLVGLVSLHAFDVPTFRCFLGGKHTQLRTVAVLSADAPGAPLSALVKACPRLCVVKYSSPDMPTPPRGWKASCAAVFRTPFDW